MHVRLSQSQPGIAKILQPSLNPGNTMLTSNLALFILQVSFFPSKYQLLTTDSPMEILPLVYTCLFISQVLRKSKIHAGSSNKWIFRKGDKIDRVFLRKAAAPTSNMVPDHNYISCTLDSVCYRNKGCTADIQKLWT